MSGTYGDLIPIGGGDIVPLMKDELIVGRSDSCDVVLRFSNISGQHCRFVLSEGYWYVIDLGSTNGVKVNGIKVTNHRVDPDVKLMIAKQTYVIKYNPVQNGAAGVKPADSYNVHDEIFKSKLLEKVGIKKPTKPIVELDSGMIVKDLEGSTMDKNKLSPALVKTKIKDNYFDELVFD
ncbi:MAG: FHA domain-containing protein [Planctomycetaceae bacterium]|jgi:adenylate cyclase|nr:FHA domain-containing protein [Planctomycetaceae bacterium]